MSFLGETRPRHAATSRIIDGHLPIPLIRLAADPSLGAEGKTVER